MELVFFSGRGIQKVLGAESPSGSWLQRFAKSSAMSPRFRAGELSIFDRINHPIKFKRPDAGGSQSGTNVYDVALLVNICSEIIEANRAGDFVGKRTVRFFRTVENESSGSSISCILRLLITGVIPGSPPWFRGFIRGLKFRQSFTNQLELHPSIFIDVILVFEYFLYVLFEFQYFSLKFCHPIHRRICKHLSHRDECAHNGSVYSYRCIATQDTRKHRNAHFRKGEWHIATATPI